MSQPDEYATGFHSRVERCAKAVDHQSLCCASLRFELQALFDDAYQLGVAHQRSVEAPRWQPVESVEPPDDTYCLVWREWPGRIGVYKCVLRQRPRVTWEGLYGWEPTHWAPLPDPPVVDQTGAQK